MKDTLLEFVLIIGLAFFWMLFFSLVVAISDRYTGEGMFVSDKKTKEHHYFLKKFKFCFLFIFLMNRKWKKGMISKYSFWSLIILYIYFVGALLTEVVFLYSGIILRTDMPLIFVGLWVLIPIVCLVAIPCFIRVIQNLENRN